MSWENNITREFSDLCSRAVGKIIHLLPGKMERFLPDETPRVFLSLKTLLPADIPPLKLPLEFTALACSFLGSFLLIKLRKAQSNADFCIPASLSSFASLVGRRQNAVGRGHKYVRD